VPPPPEVQLAWFSTALEELSAFLRSPDVFRPLHHPPPGMVQDLSLGGLLLAADVLSFLPDDRAPALRAPADQALRAWEIERASHPAAIEAKAEAEIPYRLNLWRAYLQDLTEKPTEIAAYTSEVRHRVILDRLLQIRGGEAGAKAMQMAQTDEQLRLWFRAGSFVWSSELKRAYPEGPFWYLYGGPSRVG
jgi:hypothetical protein